MEYYYLNLRWSISLLSTFNIELEAILYPTIQSAVIKQICTNTIECKKYDISG